MIGILRTKFAWLLRNPSTFLTMTVMSIAFSWIIGSGDMAQLKVSYHADNQVENTVIDQQMNDHSMIDTKRVSLTDLKHSMKSGKEEVGAVLYEDHYELHVGVTSMTTDLVHQTIENMYIRKDQLEAFHNALPEDSKQTPKEIQKELVKEPSFTMEEYYFSGRELTEADNVMGRLFGFTLFFVIYTIAYSVVQIVTEKTSGVWDRMILSPVRKWEIYAANFIYSFLIGYFQVLLILFIFRFVFHIDFQDKFFYICMVIIPYLLAIVALSIFIVGIVKSIQQFNALTSLFTVAFAMLGGAFWPLEVVESKVMLTLSKFVPVTYGLDILNGVYKYNYSLDDILYPISILLFMTVLMTGIGIHLMEKRYIST